MDNYIKESLKIKMEIIVDETKKYEFPFFADTDKKKRIIHILLLKNRLSAATTQSV